MNIPRGRGGGGLLANQLTRDYDLLASNSAGAAKASSSPDVSNNFLSESTPLSLGCYSIS